MDLCDPTCCLRAVNVWKNKKNMQLKSSWNGESHTWKIAFFFFPKNAFKFTPSASLHWLCYVIWISLINELFHLSTAHDFLQSPFHSQTHTLLIECHEMRLKSNPLGQIDFSQPRELAKGLSLRVLFWVILYVFKTNNGLK